MSRIAKEFFADGTAGGVEAMRERRKAVSTLPLLRAVLLVFWDLARLGLLVAPAALATYLATRPG